MIEARSLSYRVGTTSLVDDISLSARPGEFGGPPRVISSKLLAEVFEVDALVVPHPELACPLVVSRGPLGKRSDLRRAVAGGLETPI